MENQQLQVISAPENTGMFATSANFEHAQRVCKVLIVSNLVPESFRNNIGNAMIALELSNRIGASPLMVMQNLAVIHGKPSFSSTFLIAAINQSGKFSSLRFLVDGEGDNRGCVAWAKDSEGERLEGPRVTIEMAKKEGWYSKSGSKWQTMPELMLRYRAAAFFSRLYCPEITMGMQSREEVEDITYESVPKEDTAKKVLEIGTPAFDRAKQAIASGKHISDIQAQYELSQDVIEALTAKAEPQAEPVKEPEQALPPADIEAAINASEPIKPEKVIKGRVIKDEQGNEVKLNLDGEAAK